MPEDALDAQFDRLRQELRQDFREDIQASAAELRQDFRRDIQASAAETRRHFEVVAEGLRSEIQVVAEGLSMLDEKVERFREEVHQEFGKVDRRFLHLDARIAESR